MGVVSAEAVPVLLVIWNWSLVIAAYLTVMILDLCMQILILIVHQVVSQKQKMLKEGVLWLRQ
jgi:hypothetical protein